MKTDIERTVSSVVFPEAICEARSILYRFLSLVTSDPKNRYWSILEERIFQEKVERACRLLREEMGIFSPEALAPGELPPVFFKTDSLLKQIRDGSRELFMTLYDRLFGLLTSKEAPPYETEYCPQTFPVFRSQRMADVAGFYRAFGLEQGRAQPERPDHVSLELEFMGWLLIKEKYLFGQGREDKKVEETLSIVQDAQVHFFRDHLVWWLPAFGWALRKKADGLSLEREEMDFPKLFYAQVGTLLSSFMGMERMRYALPPPTELVSPQADESLENDPCHVCPLSIGS